MSQTSFDLLASGMKSAVISPCELYRYQLTRARTPGPVVCWVMLNPSTADANVDDPTLKRCMGFSWAWGFSQLHVVNLFAYRATKPAELSKVSDPIGPEADRFISESLAVASLVVCGWGGSLPRGVGSVRALAVEAMIREAGFDAQALAVTKSGAPSHPLYLKGDLKPRPLRQLRREASAR